MELLQRNCGGKGPDLGGAAQNCNCFPRVSNTGGDQVIRAPVKNYVQPSMGGEVTLIRQRKWGVHKKRVGIQEEV